MLNKEIVLLNSVGKRRAIHYKELKAIIKELHTYYGDHFVIQYPNSINKGIYIEKDEW